MKPREMVRPVRERDSTTLNVTTAPLHGLLTLVSGMSANPSPATWPRRIRNLLLARITGYFGSKLLQTGMAPGLTTIRS